MKLFSRLLLLVLLAVPQIIFAPRAVAADHLLLPKPRMDEGKSLMQSLSLRRSVRSFSTKEISPQILGELLWASIGVNREDGRRTAPTARNRQQVELYAALPNGVWRYDAKAHSLIQESNKDLRATAGSGTVILFYAAPEGDWGPMHVGSMYQNVGLYCASAGLNNVVRAQGIKALDGEVALPSGYKVLMTHAVGWPQDYKVSHNSP